MITQDVFEEKALDSIRKIVTVEEVADVLSIPDDRAQALLDGIIKFEASEIYLLAINCGMSYSEFIGFSTSQTKLTNK